MSLQPQTSRAPALKDPAAISAALHQYACHQNSMRVFIGASRALAQLTAYARENRVKLIIQVLGGITLMSALCALPILAAVGFSSIGPVAGTMAAGWQASIGLVQAGSLFAMCQGLAMGGAALGGLVGVGALGAVAVVAPAVVPEFIRHGKAVKQKIEEVGQAMKNGVEVAVPVVVDAVVPIARAGIEKVAEIGEDTGAKLRGLWKW